MAIEQSGRGRRFALRHAVEKLVSVHTANPPKLVGKKGPKN
jgi:hypothetical protein